MKALKILLSHFVAHALIVTALKLFGFPWWGAFAPTLFVFAVFATVFIVMLVKDVKQK